MEGGREREEFCAVVIFPLGKTLTTAQKARREAA